MRTKFENQLEELNLSLIKMGGMCETAIARAVKALLSQDIELAEQVIESSQEIGQAEREIERLCLKLLLQQQPVASDLRIISSALKMITDMKRIGDQAVDISEIVASADLASYVNSVHMKDMALTTIKMVTDSIDAFVKRDNALAKDVILSDIVVNQYFADIRDELVEMIRHNPSKPSIAIDMIIIAKYLERIADHAVNIAAWVKFAVTGQHEEEIHDDLLRRR